MNILFKLNFISQMYQLWTTEMCQNNVLLKDNHIDSMYFYLKKIYNHIDALTDVETYPQKPLIFFRMNRNIESLKNNWH